MRLACSIQSYFVTEILILLFLCNLLLVCMEFQGVEAGGVSEKSNHTHKSFVRR